MDDVVRVPVPPMVVSRYLLPLRSLPDDGLQARVEQRIEALGAFPAAFVPVVMANYSAPFVFQPASQTTVTDTRVLRVLGVRARRIRAVERARHFVVVAWKHPPTVLPLYAWAARAVAWALTEELETVALDATLPAVWDAGELRAGLPDDTRSVRAGDWIIVIASQDTGGDWLSTKGLGRFGLPELSTKNVPPHLAAPWTCVLNGLAQALLKHVGSQLGPETPDHVDLPQLVTVLGADVTAADPSLPAVDAASIVVRLDLEPEIPNHDRMLDVLPPLTFGASMGEFISDTCTTLFQPAVGTVEELDEGRIDAAIASARASLSSVRERYQAGALPGRALLRVTYREFVPPDRYDYLHAYVTSWDDPDITHASMAVQASHHRQARTGRPVAIPSVDIVDWAIEDPHRDILEGGWLTAPKTT